MLSAKQRLTRQKFEKVLSRVSIQNIFAMLWAVRAIQSNRVAHGAKLLTFPPEAATPDMTSKYAVHPWRIETILNERLAMGDAGQDPVRRKILNHTDFAGVVKVANALMSSESADDSFALNGRIDIRNEMHRLIQRQTQWQSRMVKNVNLYRAGYLYGGPMARATFFKKVGISLDDFVYSCVWLFIAYQDHVTVNHQKKRAVGIVSPDAFQIALDHISLPEAKACREAAALRDPRTHISYRKSVFRIWPLVKFGDRYCCPLPELIFQRVGGGIFYDVLSRDGKVRNEISDRFEAYSRNLFSNIFTVERLPHKFTYKRGKLLIDSPDILVESGGEVSLVVECKATKMVFDAMYAENPLRAAARGYGEIAKGVLQIWKFAAHCRMGLSGKTLAADASGVVLTLDPWLMSAQELQAQVLELARAQSGRFDYLTAEDQIPIIFCPIEELEIVHKKASMDSFLGAIRCATQQEYAGWHLSTIHEREFPDAGETRRVDYNALLPTVWPWWPKA